MALFISSVTSGHFKCALNGRTRPIIIVVGEFPAGFVGDVTLQTTLGGGTIVGATTIAFPGTTTFNVCIEGNGSAGLEVVTFTITAATSITGGGVDRTFIESNVAEPRFQLPHSPPGGGPGLDGENAGVWYRQPAPQPRGRVGGRTGQVWP